MTNNSTMKQEKQDKPKSESRNGYNKSNHKTLPDLENECLDYMATHNLSFKGPLKLNTPKPERYSKDCNKSKKNEWYIGSSGTTDYGRPFLTCTIGSWSTGEKYTYQSWKEDDSTISSQELNELRKAAQEAQKISAKSIKEEHEKTAKECNEIWNSCEHNQPSERHVAYLKLKGVKAYGIRYGNNQNGHASIIISLRNNDGQIRSLQYISVNDEGKIYKSFHSGGEKKGNYFIIGDITNVQQFYVAEGYASGASPFEAINQPVIVAFDSGNLSPVIENLRKIYKKNEVKITILADDDRDNKDKKTGKPINPGKTAAEKASKEHGCDFILPQFPDDFRLPNSKSDEHPDGKRATDFNDLFVHFGPDTVKKQLCPNVATNTSVQDELKKLSYSLLEKEEPCACFSLSEFPKPLKDYISLISETTDAHPIMITSAVLSTIAAFVQNKMFIPKGEYFQKLHPNCWQLCITKSGLFKSTAQEYGCHIARDKSAKTLAELFDIEAKLQQIPEKERKNAPLLNEKLETSKRNPILPNKITAEAFLEHLAQGHSGVVITSEFGAWLQNMEKNHNADLKAIFTELYDVPPSYRYMTKTQGDHILRDPCFSICGVSTLDWLKENLKPNDVSGGFFARFLLFTPPHNDNIPAALPRKRENQIQLYKAQENIIETLNNMNPRYEYKLSQSAKNQFESYHNQLYKMTKGYSENCQTILEPYLKRWSPYILKLAMMFRLFEDPIPRGPSEISDTAIVAAMSYLLPAIKSTAKLFEGELGESDHQRKCRLVYEWICDRVKKGKQPAWGTLLSSHKLEGGTMMYENVMKTLVESGRVNVIEKTRKVEWLYVPAN